MRTIRYREIAEAIRHRVEGGEFGAGRLLPSEAALSEEYGASRVTVRKALEELRAEGLVEAHQGLGWFASGDPLRQRLARLGTIEDQLKASGIRSEREILELRVVATPANVRRVLGVDKAVRLLRLNLADGAPFARVTVWCPPELGAHLTREQLTDESFYELLDVPLGHAVQTIAARAASADDADLLGVPQGAPVLVCERTTYDADGHAVLFATYVFPGHLTEFSVDLPRMERSIAPSGLRLVE